MRRIEINQPPSNNCKPSESSFCDEYGIPIPMFLRLGVGGNLNNTPSMADFNPRSLFVDYVRVFKKNGVNAIRMLNNNFNGISYPGDNFWVQYYPGVNYSWTSSSFNFDPNNITIVPPNTPPPPTCQQSRGTENNWIKLKPGKDPNRYHSLQLTATFPGGATETYSWTKYVCSGPPSYAPSLIQSASHFNSSGQLYYTVRVPIAGDYENCKWQVIDPNVTNPTWHTGSIVTTYPGNFFSEYGPFYSGQTVQFNVKKLNYCGETGIYNQTITFDDPEQWERGKKPKMGDDLASLLELPNPTSDHWAGQSLAEPQPEYLSGCGGEQLKLPDPTDAITAKVKFMDMSGRLIWSGPIYLSGRFDFDLATLPPGIYLKVITTLCNYPLHSEKIAIIH